MPTSRPVGNAFFTYTSFEYVVAVIHAGDATGTGLSYTVGVGGTAVKAMLDELVPMIVGRDAAQVGATHERLTRSVVPVAGMTASLAVAAIDIALWDLRAQVEGVPLHELLGARRPSVRACATGIDLNYTETELVDQVRSWCEAGYTAVKIKVGKPRLQEDVQRVEAVRAVIGPEVSLMVDANEAWTYAEAVRRIDAFRHLDLEFVEDPLPLQDVEGYRLLRSESRMPIAGGERLFSRGGVHTMLVRGGLDVLRADVCRISGITEWLSVAQLADSFGVLVAPHMVEDIALPLSCAIPNIHMLEHVPACNLAVAGLVQSPSSPHPGMFEPRSAVGHGVLIDQDVLAGFRVL